MKKIALFLASFFFLFPAFSGVMYSPTMVRSHGRDEIIKFYEAQWGFESKYFSDDTVSKFIALMLKGKNDELFNVEDLFKLQNLKLMLIFKKFEYEYELNWFKWNLTQDMVDYREPIRSRTVFPDSKILAYPDLPTPEEIYASTKNNVSRDNFGKIEDRRKKDAAIAGQNFRMHYVLAIKLSILNAMIMEKYGLQYLVSLESRRKEVESQNPDLFNPNREYFRGGGNGYASDLIDKLPADKEALDITYTKY